MCLTVKLVGESDALIGHVRFDERGEETERCRMAQATAPLLDFCLRVIRRDPIFWTLLEQADIDRPLPGLFLRSFDRAVRECFGGC